MTTRPLRIRHAMPGRIRFSAKALKGEGLSPDASESMRAREGVLWIRANPRCGSLVVGYDEKRLDRCDVLDMVHRSLFGGLAQGDLARPAGTGKGRPGECACARAAAGCGHGKSPGVFRAFMRFAAISATLGVVVAGKALFGLATSQAAAGPLGLAALAFSAPMAVRGLKRLKEKRLTLDGFLAAGAVAAVAAGEAMTAFEILWINSGAELLSAWIGERTRRGISEILNITSHHTFVLRQGVEVETAVEDVRPGDLVVLHTGEKISVDGVIEDGEAELNEAPLTGRQEFVYREKGDPVFAGTLVRQGLIYVRAQRVGDSTYLARIMRKVQDSMENRAPIEGVADRLAASLVKVGLGATVLTFVLTGSAWRAFTVLLVMACPCATVLAASTAVSTAISAAARRHILIKGGRYLEEVGKCDVVCFDKTGTLTDTEPLLEQVALMNGEDADSLIRLAASAEMHNHHPLARAIKAEAGKRGAPPTSHAVCRYHMGMGMWARVGEDEVLVGNAKLARFYEAEAGDMEVRAAAMRLQGLTVLYVFRNRQPRGLLGFASQAKPECPRVIGRLLDMGVKRILLVTGDEEAAARNLADRLGIEEVHASVMPAEKADIVKRMGGNGGKVLMVGDGINDALALTQADVGVALGVGGSEVAVEAADIALVAEDLEGLADVYGLSRATLRVAHQNFWIATGSNIAGVALGALGLLSPVAAGLVHIGHSLGVLANSSRLFRYFNDIPVCETCPLGGGHGLREIGAAEEVSEGQTPHPGTDQDRVQPGHPVGSERSGPGKVA